MLLFPELLFLSDFHFKGSEGPGCGREEGGGGLVGVAVPLP